MEHIGLVVLSAIIGYLIGAIPNGYLIARLVTGEDVRSQGSGKTGATNVRRLLGWKWFFVVLLLDAFKGALAVFIAMWIVPPPNYWADTVAGIAAVVGHSWPVYLRFKGGRGVATAMGAMAVMLPQAIIVALIVSIPLVLLSRYISLGSVTGAIIVVIVTLVIVLAWHQPYAYLVYAALAAGLIIVKHKDNIERLFAGTERRI